MTFINEHYLMTFGGSLRTSEQWSCGLRFTGSDAQTQAAEAALTDDFADALASAWATLPMVGTDAPLEWMKFNQIGLDGKYIHQWTNLVDYPDPVPSGGGGASTHVNQASLVVTLTTGANRGLANKGRIYLPAPKFNLGTDGRVQVGELTGQMPTIAAFFSTLNDVHSEHQLIVASRTREGAERSVIAVRVGAVLDTMRSRRTTLDEEYQVDDVAGFIA